MVTAARTSSQIATHMGIAFILMYALSGSASFGGLAAVLEPVCNVVLLPVHARLWRHLRARAGLHWQAGWLCAAEKLSQTGLHMLVAMAVLTWASGSLVLGGAAVALEAMANVVLLPIHDRLWHRLGPRLARQRGMINT